VTAVVGVEPVLSASFRLLVGIPVPVLIPQCSADYLNTAFPVCAVPVTSALLDVIRVRFEVFVDGLVPGALLTGGKGDVA
jgi:hypothetical protein